MSGARSQRKEKRGRREVMDLLEKHGFTPVPTIDGITTDDLRVRELPKTSFEVKRIARIGACRYMDQARTQAKDDGAFPVVMMREDEGEWLALLPADGFLTVLEVCRHAAEAKAYAEQQVIMDAMGKDERRRFLKEENKRRRRI